MLKILKENDPILREKSAEVTDIQAAIALNYQMQVALNSTKTGLALAAPQVGVLIRMFIVKPEIAQRNKIPHIIMNPSWVPMSPAVSMQEGCLSFEGVTEKKNRFPKIRLKFMNTQGVYQTKLITDQLLSQIVQHETDHLNGVLLR